MKLKNILLTTLALSPFIATPSIGFTSPDGTSSSTIVSDNVSKNHRIILANNNKPTIKPNKELKQLQPNISKQPRFRDMGTKQSASETKTCEKGKLRGGKCHFKDDGNGCGTGPGCTSPSPGNCACDPTTSKSVSGIGGGRMPPPQMQTPSGR